MITHCNALFELIKLGRVTAQQYLSHEKEQVLTLHLVHVFGDS